MEAMNTTPTTTTTTTTTINTTTTTPPTTTTALVPWLDWQLRLLYWQLDRAEQNTEN